MARRFWQQLKTGFRKFNRNFSKLLILLLFAYFLLTAFPWVQFGSNDQKVTFDGIDVTDLSNGKVVFESKFSPSLDFYGGSRIVYSMGDYQGDKQEVMQRLAQRLTAIDTAGFTISTQETSNNETNVVITLPEKQESLTNFQQFLPLKGIVSFLKENPEAATDSAAVNDQSGQFVPTTLLASYVENYEVVYVQGHYGFIIDFKEDKLPEVLLTGFSDINGDVNSRLILAIDGQPVAYQIEPFISTNNTGRAIFATGFLKDDVNSALLIKNVMSSSNSIDADLTVKSSENIPGKFDQFLQPIKLAIGLLLAVFILVLIVRLRKIGVIVAFSISFILVMVVSLSKFILIPTTRLGGISIDIQRLPLTVTAFIAILMLLSVFLIENRNQLGLMQIFRKNRPIYNLAFVKQMQLFARNKAHSWSRYLIVVAVVLFLAGIVRIPALEVFSQYFILTIIAIWFVYRFVIPTSLDFLKPMSEK